MSHVLACEWLALSRYVVCVLIIVMLVLNGIGSLICKMRGLMGLALVTYIELEEFKKRILEARYFS